MAYKPRTKDSYIRKLEREENEKYTFLLSQLSQAYDGKDTAIKASFDTVPLDNGTFDINVTFTVNQQSDQYLELNLWLFRMMKNHRLFIGQ